MNTELNTTFSPIKATSMTMRNNVKLIPLACNFVGEFARHLGFSDEEKVTTILIWVKEVLTRRMTNGFKGVGEVTLELSVGMDRLVIDVIDKGAPYWIDIVSQVNIYPRKADEFIMKKLGVNGQCLRMVFYFSPDVDVLSLRKQDDLEEVLLDSNLKIQRVSENDAEITEVMKCIYYTYGYAYPNYKVYDIDQMKAILAEGRQWSYVGVNDHGQILGHVALSFHDDFPGVPEVCALVSKQFCRGHNVAGRLVEQACQNAESEGVNGLFAIPVAFHPYSEKVFQRLAFVPTGIFLHYVPSSCTVEYDGEERRLDAFVCAKIFKQKPGLQLCVPDEHREFIDRLYHKLGMTHDFVEASDLFDETKYSMGYNSQIGICEVTVDRVGRDFGEEFEMWFKDCYKNNVEMMKVYLNMQDTSAVKGYELLKEKGFFFTGILPGADSGEYLIMQNLMGQTMEWDKVVVIESYQELFDYVRSHANV